MPSSNSPLEILAAFAIVFVTGALSAVGLVKYVERYGGMRSVPIRRSKPKYEYQF